ncbi:MAG TPA: alpha/beta fold hydrolase [Rudaea sp.]
MTADDGMRSGEHVVLLHGLWMRAFTLASLRRRLEAAGYAVVPFDYASVLRDPQASIAQLAARVRALPASKVHYVGHSLGGLIALQALQQAPDLPPGHVVCLGSPLRGSAVARNLARIPGGTMLIGKSAAILRDGLDRWNGERAVGVIAGRMPMGFGMLTGALSGPHDGTVSVAETELPGLSDHHVVAATHVGLLFSDEVAAQTIAFLRAQRFARG